MAQEKLRCPLESCREELKGWRCEHHGDIRDLFHPTGISDEEITDLLVNRLSCFLDGDRSTVVMPGVSGQRPCAIETHKLQPDRLQDFVTRIQVRCGVTDKRLSRHRFNDYVVLQHGLLLTLPHVKIVGDRPMLFRLEDVHAGRDELYWPFQDSKLNFMVHQVLGYSGPGFTPKRTGALEEFVHSVRCADEDSEQVLYGWMIGSVLQYVIGPGASPILMLCAKSHSVGKTTTADVLRAILGGGLALPWTNDMSMDDVLRQLLDPRARCFCIDNIVPPNGSRVFNNHVVCNLITTESFQTKLLYGSGFISSDNYVAWMGTANLPSFASDLLARSCICELSDKRVPKTVGWAAHWAKRRTEVLADAMAIAIENWQKGPFPVTGRFRFTNWLNYVARAIQAEPMTLPRNTIVRAPIEHCLDEVFAGSGQVEQVSMADAVQFINSAAVGWCGTTRQIQTVEEDSIRADLAAYNALYSVQTREGTVWVVREKV